MSESTSFSLEGPIEFIMGALGLSENRRDEDREN